jgi:hypothetical protein
MLRRRIVLGMFALGVAVAVGLSGIPGVVRAAQQPHTQAKMQGSGIVIELDKQFIDDYENRATIESEFKIADLSAVHKPDKDGEVHIGGWAYEAGLPCVAEVMNAANKGKKPRLTFQKALNAEKKVTVTGAWRLWCEHGGTTPQIQAKGTEPEFPLPGEYESNPDHVFEIHPVTTVKFGDTDVDATEAIGETPGFTPYDAQQAFLADYETRACTIIPKDNRVRILTEAARHNFAEFVIRLGEDPVPLADGHGVICSVYDTEGELVVRNRRMVFVKGTAADTEVHGLKKGKRLKVIGIPRISLKLIKWRINPDRQNEQHDTNPLQWKLPYEMIIVAAERMDD